MKWLLTNGVLMLVAATAAWAAEDRTFMLMNKAQQQVTAFKVVPVNNQGAVIDMLAGAALNVNASRPVTIPSATDQCSFDLEITFADGTSEKREAVDFCNTDGYIIEK
jgi:hypothetical protein